MKNIFKAIYKFTFFSRILGRKCNLVNTIVNCYIFDILNNFFMLKKNLEIIPKYVKTEEYVNYIYIF